MVRYDQRGDFSQIKFRHALTSLVLHFSSWLLSSWCAVQRYVHTPSKFCQSCQQWSLTSHPLHCAMAVMRKHQSKPTWSTKIPPINADPLQPNAAMESTALHLPLLLCRSKPLHCCLLWLQTQPHGKMLTSLGISMGSRITLCSSSAVSTNVHPWLLQYLVYTKGPSTYFIGHYFTNWSSTPSAIVGGFKTSLFLILYLYLTVGQCIIGVLWLQDNLSCVNKSIAWPCTHMLILSFYG